MQRDRELSVLVFQKPKIKKHRAKNNKRPTMDDLCMYCKTPYAQTHECFGGRNRQLSIKYELQVKLCNSCHLDITNEKRPDLTLEIKRFGQRKFESQFGHEKFMEVIGWNYL